MATGDSIRPKAVVTGASSGLGEAFARRLAHDQHDLVIVARRRDRLDALADRLQQDYRVEVEVMSADLTQPADLLSVEKRLASDPAITLLVNNAGFGGYMPFVELEPDQAEELIRLKITALTRLTRAALPGMIARGNGAVINVSSRLAYSATIPSPPLPKRATYAASNAFIIVFSQLLAGELDGSGVRVQALCPGVVQTEFHEHVGANPASFPAGIVMTPGDVVQASLAALDQGDVVCIPALNDLDLLAQVNDSQRLLFEQTRSGTLAQRYQP